MWMTLSANRLLFLLILAAMMLISVSQVNSQNIGLPCCHKGGMGRIRSIKECYEQKPRHDCNNHAFLILTANNEIGCIDPSSKWLKYRMQKGLKCRPDII
ncbi:CX chemokine ligand 34b, duplicate 11 [Menidia menidia]